MFPRSRLILVNTVPFVSPLSAIALNPQPLPPGPDPEIVANLIGQ